MTCENLVARCNFTLGTIENLVGCGGSTVVASGKCGLVQGFGGRRRVNGRTGGNFHFRSWTVM